MCKNVNFLSFLFYDCVSFVGERVRNIALEGIFLFKRSVILSHFF